MVLDRHTKLQDTKGVVNQKKLGRGAASRPEQWTSCGVGKPKIGQLFLSISISWGDHSLLGVSGPIETCGGPNPMLFAMDSEVLHE